MSVLGRHLSTHKKIFGLKDQNAGNICQPNLDFRDHVARNISSPVAGLAPVEAIRVLFAVDLDELAFSKGQLLVAGVRVGRHRERVVVEQGDADLHGGRRDWF